MDKRYKIRAKLHCLLPNFFKPVRLWIGHDTFLVIVSFQPMLLHLSWLEMGNTRLLIASQLDLSLKKCLTFGGPQYVPNAVNISENFLQKKFAAALQHLKPGKAPAGPHSICSELILHPGAALKSFCANSKFPRSGEERLWSRSPNQQSPWGTRRVIDRYLCFVSPTRSLRDLSTPALSH